MLTKFSNGLEHSTMSWITGMLGMIEQLKEGIDQENFSIGVFVGFQKAFNIANYIFVLRVERKPRFCVRSDQRDLKD